MKHNTRSVWTHNLTFLLAFLILSFALTSPALLHLNDRVMGGYAGDNFQFLWELWYVAHRLFDLHKSPFFDPDIYVPFGFSLIRNQDLSPGTVLLFAPLTQMIGEVATYNVLMIGSFTLTAFGSFLLALELWRNRLAAFFAAITIAFSAYHSNHAGSHLSIASTQWIPFFFLYLERSLKRPTFRNGALTGLFFALGAWTTWYYAWATPIAAVFYLSLRLEWGSSEFKPAALVATGAVAVGIALLLILPFAIPYALATLDGAMSGRSIGESQAFAASVADYVIPSIHHPIWGDWVARHWRSGANGLWLSEWELYIGVPVALLALLGIFRASQRRLVWALLALASGCFVLSLGPSLYITHPPAAGGANMAPLSSIWLPVLLLSKIPPFSFLRAWARMGFYVQIAAALLAAGGLSYLLEKPLFLKSFRGTVVGIAVIGIALLEMIAIPFGTAAVSGRAVDRWLAKQPGNAIVMEYPIPENAYSGPAMYFTRLTGKRIVMGYASYPPNAAYFPILAAFPSGETLDLLETWGVDYVLVNADLYRTGSEFCGIWQTWPSLVHDINAESRLKELTVFEGVHVYRLQPKATSPIGDELLANPGFELVSGGDASNWTTVGDPLLAQKGTQSHSGNSACAVSSSAYLISAVTPVEPSTCYRLQLFAKRANQKPAAVRLEVIWLDARHRPLPPGTIALEVAKVEKEWQLYQAYFKAPPSGCFAQIYAVTQMGRAWLDDYSFRPFSNCQPALQAIPNPALVPPNGLLASAALSWNSYDGADTWVGVSRDGAPEIPYAQGSAGVRILTDLAGGSLYEFRLHDSSSTILQHLTLSATPFDLLTASPVSLSPGGKLGSTQIAWRMPEGETGEVWVSIDGGPEALFAAGDAGTEKASWIAPGSSYEFQLYNVGPPRVLRARVRVPGPVPKTP
ncbi:MAG: hypothetical protein ACR2II_00820 [Chthoniobacterales bacterium]